MTSINCGVVLQIEDMVSLSTREWTIAGLALFFLFVTALTLGLVIRRLVQLWRDDVKALVAARNDRENGWREDLRGQIVKRGEDSERLEKALADYAAAQRETARTSTGLAERVGALERRCEAIDRRAEAILVAVDRRGSARGD